MRNLTGIKFGKLIAIYPCRTSTGVYGWKCKCACGKEVVIRTADLTNGHTTSCGCLRKEITSTHNLSKTLPYDTWVSMVRRCHNSRDKDYVNYGARGITVCSEWLSYPNFYKWMTDNGYVKGLTIDRIDNDKGYSPENCRLVTMRVQQQNRRNTIFVKLDGVTLPLIEVSRKFNIHYQTLYYRHKHNHDLLNGGAI